MKNQSFWRKLGDFAMGKGFYIVLFLCVATIGISGYYLLQTVVKGTRPAEPAGGGASVTIPDQSVGRPSTPVPGPDKDPSAVSPRPQAELNPAPAAQPDDPEPVKDTAPEPDTQESGNTVSKVFTGRFRGRCSGTTAWRPCPWTPPWGTGAPTADWISPPPRG